MVNDDAFGLLSPNSCASRKVPVNTNSLIHMILPRPFIHSFFRNRLQHVLSRCWKRGAVFCGDFSLIFFAISFLFPYRSDGKGGVQFDVVFGPAYKGISLGAVVSSALYSDFGVDVGFAYNRKEAKDHGEGGKLVGANMAGKRVLVVDDVITAGTAIREAYQELKAVGAEPVGVVIALDRAEIRALDDKVSAVQAVARDLSINVVSIVNLKELQAFLEQSPDYDDTTLQSVVDYRKQYGAS